jgi:hypothetical protein
MSQVFITDLLYTIIKNRQEISFYLRVIFFSFGKIGQEKPDAFGEHRVLLLLMT